MARIRILGGIFIAFVAVFLMSHNTEAATAPEIYSSSYVGIRYQICNYIGAQYQPYSCGSVKFSDLSSPTLVDSATNTAQYVLDIDTTDCTNSFTCYLRVNYIDVQAREEVDNSYVLPDPNFLNIKFWSVADFYMGDNTKLFGDNYGGYWYIGDSLDAWLGTNNEHYSCKDNESQCNFGYWLNTVDYDTNNIYSGISVSVDSDLVPSNFFRFYSSPLNLSTGSISPSYYDYSTVLINAGAVDPFVIYLQAYGSESMETVEDNGTDIANDYYQSELEAVNSIQNQSPSDLNTGDSGTATNLIGYITTFISYISNITPASDCGVDLSFPQYAGGTQSVNLCQFKENFGNIVSIFSSLVLVLFYIPLAYKMLGIIYSEIRSFTNG